MVSKSHFVLHSRVVPPLKAGDYVLEADQKISDPHPDPGVPSSSFPTEPYRGHLRVNSPRYRMPPDQILSTFPPANADGAFENRLPQIVLRRRTLPWERKVDADEKIPWLALVVIAEGEGAISAESPIADCVTPDIPPLTGPNDTPTGVFLSVPQTTLNKVFPTKEDLQLLAHVREVDLSDTELAMGDDDGFLAVVLANRLPQFDRVGCKPARYLACLINLEGQVNSLPPPTPPAPTFFPNAFVFNAQAATAFTQNDIDKTVMGAPVINPVVNSVISTAARPTSAAAIGGSSDVARRSTVATAPAAKTTTSQPWATSPASIEKLAVSAHTKEAGSVVRDAMGSKFRFPIDSIVAEKIFRFPVLTYWSFTCTGAGSFETLMRGLDVGMLGTVAGRPSGKPFPECFAPRGGDVPPDPPPTRPEAELAESGHVGLPHLTRRGEPVRAWYRGPLVPNLTQRETAPPGGRLPLAHVSDQLRRLVPDGREDLAYACAFEIGRLLALSNPSVVAALARWRTEQFGAARAKRFSDVLTANIAVATAGLSAQAIGKLGAQVNRAVVELAAATPEKILGATRPLVDPGRPIEGLGDDLGAVLATGFGLERARVSQALKIGDAGLLESLAVPARVPVETAPQDLGHLSRGLDTLLEQLTNDTLTHSGPAPIPVPGGRPAIGARRGRTDAAAPSGSAAEERGRRVLQNLLRAAARRAREETDR